MGLGPIPRSAIMAYAEEFDMDGDEFVSFERMIRAMDNEYLSLASTKKPQTDKGMTASADDPASAHAVMEVIKSRAAAANKKQVKRKTH